VKDKANPPAAVQVTVVGFTSSNSLLGEADSDVSPSNVFNVFSPVVELPHVPGTTGAMKALVPIAVNKEPDFQSSYQIEVSCRNTEGNQVGNPSVTLLQENLVDFF
jgi:hypothetical protein